MQQSQQLDKADRRIVMLIAASVWRCPQGPTDYPVSLMEETR